MLFLLLMENLPDDADFLAEVYHRHQRLLYGQALKVLRNPQDAEETPSPVSARVPAT
ncbi:MAG TPA: hypothetical protein PLR12_08295 [Clostridia bacterium]|nr:hypothetical protein [Clostridia bacterium]